jgi:hypothetical protein
VRRRTARHLQAAAHHDHAVVLHKRAARFWMETGNLERAEVEARKATMERDAAQLERERAKLAADAPSGGT